MIVVADTSPLNYLILIQEIEILSKMYGRVVIPLTVRAELLHPKADQPVRSWISNPPAWLEILAPAALPEGSLKFLDPGERDAILLVQELRAEYLIVDDRQGRREAEKRGIAILGTLGVLREAARHRLLDIGIAVKRLEGTNFYVDPEVLKSITRD